MATDDERYSFPSYCLLSPPLTMVLPCTVLRRELRYEFEVGATRRPFELHPEIPEEESVIPTYIIDRRLVVVGRQSPEAFPLTMSRIREA